MSPRRSRCRSRATTWWWSCKSASGAVRSLAPFISGRGLGEEAPGMTVNVPPPALPPYHMSAPPCRRRDTRPSAAMMPSTAPQHQPVAGEALSPLLDQQGRGKRRGRAEQAAASAKASEKQVVRTWAGTISTSAQHGAAVDAEIEREHHLDREQLAEGGPPRASTAPGRPSAATGRDVTAPACGRSVGHRAADRIPDEVGHGNQKRHEQGVPGSIA